MKPIALSLVMALMGCTTAQLESFRKSTVGKSLASAGKLVIKTATRVGKTLLLQKLAEAQAQVEHKQLEGLRK